MKNSRLHSIELITQTSTGTLVLESFINTFYQTKNLSIAWNNAAEISNKNGFTFPFWLMVGFDILKLIR